MSSVLVTGGTGMVGSALKRIRPEAFYVSSSQCDMRMRCQVEKLFDYHKPDYVIHLAAKVGGLKANMDNMADFYYDNILINTNVLNCAHKSGVKKMVSLLSTCVYPDQTEYPLVEGRIHSGRPHKSNFAYAYTKRMLDVQSRAYRKQYGCNFITAVPNNLFGEGDNFDLQNSHVIPAIIHKMYEAKQTNSDILLWGDGSPLREFTYSRDLADILLFLLDHYEEKDPINIGNTEEYTIKEIAEMIADILQFKGNIVWDTSKPKGQYRKPSDNSKLIELGWRKENYSNIRESLKNVCEWFTISYPSVRGVK